MKPFRFRASSNPAFPAVHIFDWRATMISSIEYAEPLGTKHLVSTYSFKTHEASIEYTGIDGNTQTESFEVVDLAEFKSAIISIARRLINDGDGAIGTVRYQAAKFIETIEQIIEEQQLV